MFGIVSVSNSCFDAGSLSLAIAKRWNEPHRLLLIDVDPHGSTLADRYGTATRSVYLPAERGLPSLMVAREPLTLTSITSHCYSLEGCDCSLWALFGPQHPVGAKCAAIWLCDRASELSEVHRERRVIIASSLHRKERSVIPLLQRLSSFVIVAPVGDRDEARALRLLCDDLEIFSDASNGLRKVRHLIVEGPSQGVGDNEIMAITKLDLVGRLPRIDDEKLLHLQGGRKDRLFMRELENVALKVLEVSGFNTEDSFGDSETLSIQAGSSLGSVDANQMQGAVVINGENLSTDDRNNVEARSRDTVQALERE